MATPSPEPQAPAPAPRTRWTSASTTTPIKTSHPLFLAIESGVKSMRAVVLDERLNVVWVEEVDFDVELGAEFSVVNGCRTFGDEVTAPSAMRVKGLDLLLEKLAREAPDPSLMGRIRAISGSGQPNTVYYLTPAVAPILSTLGSHSSSRLSTLLSPSVAFSVESPANSCDRSTFPQCAELEARLGSRRRDGAIEMARRTGSKACSGSTASQIMKVRVIMEANGGSGGAMGTTERLCLESNFLASLFIGRFAPIDAADACCTNLFNVLDGDWDDEVLGIVMGDNGLSHIDAVVENGGGRLKGMLGDVGKDGGEKLGNLSPYFVERFGFSTHCIVIPFTGSGQATFLSQAHNLGPRVALISLGDSDTFFVPSDHYCPDVAHHIILHPAAEVGQPAYVAMISNRGTGIGRSLTRDLYCNGRWDVFSRLVDMVPHGGSIGLDDKLFSFFISHGAAGVEKGFFRFLFGGRIHEFTDRKVNPRLLLESQFLALRVRLSRLYTSLDLFSSSPSSTIPSAPTSTNPLGFDEASRTPLPSRIIVVGAATQNPSMMSLLSTILGARAFAQTVEHRTTSPPIGKGEDAVPGAVEEGVESGRTRVSSAALGAGYKAAWGWARSQGSTLSFSEFVSARKARSDAADVPPRRDDLVPVAEPDEDYFRYYSSMLREFVRLESFIARGVV